MCVGYLMFHGLHVPYITQGDKYFFSYGHLAIACGLTDKETSRRLLEIKDPSRDYLAGIIYVDNKVFMPFEDANLWLCRLRPESVDRNKRDKLLFVQRTFAREVTQIYAESANKDTNKSHIPHKEKMKVVAPPPSEKSLRSAISQLLRSYCVRTGFSYEKAWRDLYREFKYRNNIDLSIRSTHSGQDRLDIAEELGVIPKLHSVAAYLFN